MKSSEFEGCQDHACSIQGRCSHAKIKAYINALKEERTLSQKRERYDFLPREMPDDRIGPGIPERMKQLSEKPLDLDCEITRQYIATLQSQLAASQERETVSMNSDNLCTPHKIFLNSQNLTGCVLCERNKEIEDLKAQLAASQERERILRDGLEKYAHTGNWAHMEMNPPHRNLWMQWGNGYDIAERTLKAAEEVKG